MGDSRFEGRKAAVTGAGGFIGNAICRRLAADGVAVLGLDVNPAAGLAPIPAGQRDHVVGKHAGADLFPGTLLTRDQLTDLAIPAPGQQLVGTELRPAQLPARTLKPGDAVILVVVPPSSLAGAPDPQASSTSRPVTITATVAGASPPETNGNVRVDVAVAQSDGP